MSSRAPSESRRWQELLLGGQALPPRRHRGARLEALVAVEADVDEDPAAPVNFYLNSDIYKEYLQRISSQEKEEEEDDPDVAEVLASPPVPEAAPQPAGVPAASNRSDVDVESFNSVWVRLFSSGFTDKSTGKATFICGLPSNGQHKCEVVCDLNANGSVQVGNLRQHLKAQHNVRPARDKPSIFERLVSYKTKSKTNSAPAESTKAEFERWVNEVKQDAAQRAASNSGARRSISSWFVKTEGDIEQLVRDCHQLLFMIGGGLSFRFGSNPIFHSFVKSLPLQPWADYTLPSPTRLRTSILDLVYAAVIRANVSSFVKANVFTITFDAWTSRAMNHSLLAITYHWCDDSMNMREMVLDTVPLTTSHTSANLAAAIARRVHFRSTPDQVLYTGVTDNAANVRKACDAVINRLEQVLDGTWSPEENEVDEDGGVDADVEKERAIACVAHTVNLVLGDALKNDKLKKVVDDMSSVIAAVNRSHQRKLALREVQHVLGKRVAMPVSYVSTRWGSLMHSIERFLELYDPLLVLLATGAFDNSEEDTVRMPDEDAKGVLKSVLSILRPFLSLTTLLQGSRYMTAPHVQHWIRDVTKQIQNVHLSDFAVIAEDVRAAVLASLKERTKPYFEPEHPFTLAALLHPTRTAETVLELNKDKAAAAQAITKLVEWSHLINFDLETAATKVVGKKRPRSNYSEVEALMGSLSSFVSMGDGDGDDEGAASSSCSDEVSASASLTDEQVEQLVREDKQKRLDDIKGLMKLLWDAAEAAPVKECSPEQADSSCRAFYATRPPSEVLLAALVFSTLATSASSERVFSTSGVIDSAIRNRMAATTLEKLTVIQCFLKQATDSEIATLLEQIDSWLRSDEDKNLLQELANAATYFK